MERELVGYLSVILLVLLLGMGVPIGFSMLFLGVVGYWLMQGSQAAFAILGGTIWANFNNYALTVVPLFVLMGHFAYYSDFGSDVFTAIRKWFGNIRGSLAMAACFGCAAFGTVSGDSVSTTMTIGKIAIPEMKKNNYDLKLAIGSIASAAPIAAMIPPSTLMCMYGMVVEQSIGKLLIGGVLPGILTAIIFAITVGIWAHLNPRIAPRTQEKFRWKDKFASLKDIWIVAICALLILGGIYTGVFTPTEAGGIAALVVLLAGVFARRLDRKKVWRAVIDSAKITGTVTIIMAGALMFNAMFTLTGITEKLVNLLAPEGVSTVLVLVGIMALYLILGFFMNAVAMLFLTMPFVFPIVTNLGVNPIWFGIMVVHMCEVGSITPPFGITLFAVKTILPKETSSTTILRGVVPFFIAYLAVLALLLAFPQIALFLPGMMG